MLIALIQLAILKMVKERDYYNEIKPLIGVELNGIVNGDDGMDWVCNYTSRW